MTERNPYLNLLDAMDIPAAEKRGQRDFVASTTLPTEGPWAEAEALGVIRGAQVPGDDLFTEATLPEGWHRAGTEHDMWADVVDGRGIKRLNVFYKAAFYDRRAFWSIANVGWSVISEVLYPEDSNTPVSLPAVWDLLDMYEQAEAENALRNRLAHAREYKEKALSVGMSTESYERDIPRAEALLALIDKTPGKV